MLGSKPGSTSQRKPPACFRQASSVLLRIHAKHDVSGFASVPLRADFVIGLRWCCRKVYRRTASLGARKTARVEIRATSPDRWKQAGGAALLTARECGDGSYRFTCTGRRQAHVAAGSRSVDAACCSPCSIWGDVWRLPRLVCAQHLGT
jgi:hypothetical protein